MMGITKIEWTSTPRPDGTLAPGFSFNPWRGCTKISAGCTNCYAETMSHRNPEVLGEWGPLGTRVIAAESYWRQPLCWDREAQKAGERRRVFTASLADVFEDRPELMAPRMRLFELIGLTPHLDWLVLTKRPDRIETILDRHFPGYGVEWLADSSNVWLGVSVENQEWADKRIPILLRLPVRVRFLSCEPLLGPVDLTNVSAGRDVSPDWMNALTGEIHCSHPMAPGAHLDWVIVGGESGSRARPMDLDWALSLVEQCWAARVPVFVKQLGRRPYIDHSPEPAATLARKHGVGPVVAEFLVLDDKKGADPNEWPEVLKVREFPLAREGA